MLLIRKLDGGMTAIRTAFLSEDRDQLELSADQLEGMAGDLGDDADLSMLQERMEDLATTCRDAAMPATQREGCE